MEHNKELETIRKRVAKTLRELQSALNEWTALIADEAIEPADEPLDVISMPTKSTPAKAETLERLRLKAIQLLKDTGEPLARSRIIVQISAGHNYTASIFADPRFIFTGTLGGHKKVWIKGRALPAGYEELEARRRADRNKRMITPLPSRKAVRRVAPPPREEYIGVVIEVLRAEQPLTLDEIKTITKIPYRELWEILSEATRFERQDQLYWLNEPVKHDQGGTVEPMPVTPGVA
jgi:hypothetical protein